MANEIKPEMVPDKVVAALVNALYVSVDVAWSDARAGIAAALNAWPEMAIKTTFWPNVDGVWIVPRPALSLPLTTQEPGDE